MRRTWLRRIAVILSIPIVLLLLITVLLYVPPVQNYLRREVTSIASERTGLDISVGRITLRFPLKLRISEVLVMQKADTLLNMESLLAHVQLFPLLKGQLKVEAISLRRALLHTGQWLKDVQIDGLIGQLDVTGHGIDLNHQIADLNKVELLDSRIAIRNTDTVAQPDSASTPANWLIRAKNIKLRRVDLGYQTTADNSCFSAHIGETTLHNASADILHGLYSLEALRISRTELRMDTDTLAPHSGFDFEHIGISELHLDIDSITYQGREMSALIREGKFRERSGVHFTSLNGRFKADSLAIYLNGLHAATPNSDFNLSLMTEWAATELRDGAVSANLSANIGPDDVFFLADSMPAKAREAYPQQPLHLKLNVTGTLDRLRIGYVRASLPQAFSLTGTGMLHHLTDSVRRKGHFGMSLHTEQLDFISAWLSADSSLVVPAYMNMEMGASLLGSKLQTTFTAKEADGTVQCDGQLDMRRNIYQARLTIDSLNVQHFFPRDSLKIVTAQLTMNGSGLDLMAPATSAHASFHLDNAQYGRYKLQNFDLTASLQNTVASVGLNSQNVLLKGQISGKYALNKPYTEASLMADIKDINLYQLGLSPAVMPKPIVINLNAHAASDSVHLMLTAGDFTANYRSRGSVERVAHDTQRFAQLLQQQIEAQFIDHDALRRALPASALRIHAGKNNPLADYLKITANIRYKEFNVNMAATPSRGMNGNATITELRVDTLQLDSLFFATAQDTTKIRLHGGVKNGPHNPHIQFAATLDGEVRNNDADLTLQYLDSKGRTGVLLGVNMRPQGKGMAIKFTPEQPVVAFRKLSLKDHNYIYTERNRPIQVDVEMLDAAGTGFTAHSQPDSTALDNINFEVRRISLQEYSDILPYLPDFAGLLSLEANYQLTESGMQISAEATADHFAYNNIHIGNVGMGATWVPTGRTQYVDAYLTADNKQIMSANGSYDSDHDRIDVSTTLEHFPLRFANVLVAEQMAVFKGDADGELTITGTAAQPRVDGSMFMDSVHIVSPSYGVQFSLDPRPIPISNSRMTFKNYAVYSLVDVSNPFTINGYVDFADPLHARADLVLSARNYPLLNARRTQRGNLYGRINVDLNSTLRGQLNSLVMRGNLNILPNTNATYVMHDSPLTVQNRLGDLVEFTSFAMDTVRKEPAQVMQTSWGGLDMLLNINIDPAVRMGADLSPDRNSYVTLEGGGALSFHYTPEGSMSLTGRYELSGGSIRYALSVIPLKTFNIKDGSYVEWTGNVMNPRLNLQAIEHTRASVPEGKSGNGSPMVDFDVSILISNNLQNPNLTFTLDAPDRRDIQDRLNAMDEAERGKQAIALMVSGVYLGGVSSGQGFDMSNALSSLISSSLVGIVGPALDKINLTFGLESYDDQTGTHTDYRVRYAQRFFNDRIQFMISGRVRDDVGINESFIDNVSLEYRLDKSNSRYLQLFHNTQFDSFFDGEITETGVGLVLRKKVNRLSELFLFRRKKEETPPIVEPTDTIPETP